MYSKQLLNQFLNQVVLKKQYLTTEGAWFGFLIKLRQKGLASYWWSLVVKFMIQ